MAVHGEIDVRYRMLETIREYAAERLDRAGGVDAARTAITSSAWR